MGVFILYYLFGLILAMALYTLTIRGFSWLIKPHSRYSFDQLVDFLEDESFFSTKTYFYDFSRGLKTIHIMSPFFFLGTISYVVLVLPIFVIFYLKSFFSNLNNNIKELEQLPPIPNIYDDYEDDESIENDLNFKTMDLVFNQKDQISLVCSNEHPKTSNRKTGHLKLVK